MLNKKENILGIDIGGSKIKMILRDNGKVLKEWRTEGATLDNLKKGLEFFSGALGSSNFKVGIGAPGLIDFENGEALFCQNLPGFNNIDLKKVLKKEINPHTKQSYGVGVKVDNDAKCFLRAEIAAAKGNNLGYVLGVIFGTGIGGAIKLVQSSKCKVKSCDYIYRGRDGWAGEFGHMIIDKGKSWEKLYQETKNKPKEQERINAIGLANLINIFNPELIILGGKGARPLSKQGVQLLAKNLLLPKQQMPKIVLAKLGDNAVAIGAIMLWD